PLRGAGPDAGTVEPGPDRRCHRVFFKAGNAVDGAGLGCAGGWRIAARVPAAIPGPDEFAAGASSHLERSPGQKGVKADGTGDFRRLGEPDQPDARYGTGLVDLRWQ